MLFIPHKHLYISGTSYISADEPDYKEVITDANSRRRMGRLLKMAVWCGLKSLDGVPSERVAGIITSTGAGFMKDTISFGSSIFDREETLLNPSPFMQSTFNTASGYIALIRKIRAYNTTYVQQADGFAASLVDAAMLLDDAGEGNVALVGAFDEVTPEVDVIRQRLGLYRVGDGFLPLGEGAAAFLLSAAMTTDVSGSCQATELSTGPGGGDGSESVSERGGDANSECSTGPLHESESASEWGGESGSESSTGPLRESESVSCPCDESGSESASERGGDEAGSESASERGGDANFECSTGPLRESESASRPCDESGSESSSEPLHESESASERGGDEAGSVSASERGGDANSEFSTGHLHESVSASEHGGDANSEFSTGPLRESESASWPCDESGSESSSEPLDESGGTSSRSLIGTKDGNAALRFCGLANLPDLPKCAGNPIAELFGINACINVISCADHVESLGAFRSLLPVLLCKLISEQKIPDGYTAIVDDVNEDGVIFLLHK